MSGLERYHDLSVTEEIGGLKYTSTKFPATQALALMTRTIKVLGDSGLQAFVGMRAKQLADKVPKLILQTRPQLYKAAVAIAYGLGEDPELPKALCGKLKCDKRRPAQGSGPVAEKFDSHFQGEYPHLIDVLGFVLVHNFAGFTIGSRWLSGSRGTEKTAEETPSNSQTPNEESSPETSTP